MCVRKDGHLLCPFQRATLSINRSNLEFKLKFLIYLKSYHCLCKTVLVPVSTSWDKWRDRHIFRYHSFYEGDHNQEAHLWLPCKKTLPCVSPTPPHPPIPPPLTEHLCSLGLALFFKSCPQRGREDNARNGRVVPPKNTSNTPVAIFQKTHAEFLTCLKDKLMHHSCLEVTYFSQT